MCWFVSIIKTFGSDESSKKPILFHKIYSRYLAQSHKLLYSSPSLKHGSPPVALTVALILFFIFYRALCSWLPMNLLSDTSPVQSPFSLQRWSLVSFYKTGLTFLQRLDFESLKEERNVWKCLRLRKVHKDCSEGFYNQKHLNLTTLQICLSQVILYRNSRDKRRMTVLWKNK